MDSNRLVISVGSRPPYRVPDGLEMGRSLEFPSPSAMIFRRDAAGDSYQAFPTYAALLNVDAKLSRLDRSEVWITSEGWILKITPESKKKGSGLG